MFSISLHCPVNKCVSLVQKSKKPVIVLGSQATLPPTEAGALANALTVSAEHLASLHVCGRYMPRNTVPCVRMSTCLPL